MRKLLKKGIIFLMLVLSITVFAAAPVMAKKKKVSTKTYKKAYTAFAKKQQKKSDKQLYMAIIYSTDQPVLLLTDLAYRSYESGYKKWWSTDAKIYQYKNGKVRFVTKIVSTGTGYPLCRRGAYLFAGFHHSSTRMRISKCTATVESLYGLYMENNKKCRYIKKIVKNGKTVRKTKYKRLSSAKAEAQDYYEYGIKGKVIAFKKVS